MRLPRAPHDRVFPGPHSQPDGQGDGAQKLPGNKVHHILGAEGAEKGGGGGGHSGRTLPELRSPQGPEGTSRGAGYDLQRVMLGPV